MRDTGDTGRRGVGGILLSYALLFVVFVLSIVAIYAWYLALPAVIFLMFGRTFANRAFFQCSLTLFVIALFGLLASSEPYLRRGAEQGILWQRFARLALPLVVAILIAFALRGIASSITP